MKAWYICGATCAGSLLLGVLRCFTATVAA